MSLYKTCIKNSQSIRPLVWAANCMSCQRGHKPQFWEAANASSRRLRRTCCSCSKFYWNVGHCPPSTARESSVGLAGRIHSTCWTAKEGIDSLDVRCSDKPAPRGWRIGQPRDYNSAEDFLYSDVRQHMVPQYSQSVQRLRTMTWRMWSDADRSLLNVMPRILSELSQVKQLH